MGSSVGMRKTDSASRLGLLNFSPEFGNGFVSPAALLIVSRRQGPLAKRSLQLSHAKDSTLTCREPSQVSRRLNRFINVLRNRPQHILENGMVKNGIAPQTSSATRIRLLMDEIVEISKSRRDAEPSSSRDSTEPDSNVGDKALALLAELLESRVEDETNDSPDKNPDSNGLGYRSLGGSEVVGFVDHVNGGQAVACPEYSPTKHELQQLAKHWIERSLDLDFYWFQTQSTGSSEWREREFAERRLSRLA